MLAAVQHPVFRPSTPESIRQLPPLMPMPTGLRLDATNEALLVNYALDRLENSRSSYGARTDSSGWLSKRRVATNQFQNDFSHRASIKDSIWEKSNRSLHTVGRIIRLSTARLCDDLLGTTDPFFSLSPDLPEFPRVMDLQQAAELEAKLQAFADMVKGVERWANYKAKECGAREVLRMAILGALIRGEAVVKRRWSLQRKIWWTVDLVAATREGQVILDRGGKRLTRHEEFEAHASIKGAMVLTRDPKVVLPPDVQWVDAGEEGQIQTEERSKLDLSLVWFEDFHCPTTERDIQSAEFISQTMDLPLYRLQALLATASNRDMAQRIVNEVRAFDASVAEAGKQPDMFRGEVESSAERIPSAACAECYMTVDADGDGEAEEVMMIVERQTRRPIFYDYLSNVMQDRLRPYDAVRILPVENRWYGTGLYEKHAPLDEFIDLCFNRVNIRASTAGRADFVNPQATREGAAGEAIVFGRGKAYVLNDGYTAEQAMGYVVAPPLEETNMQLMELGMQVIGLESGNLSAGEGAISSMPASDLATGIKSLERAGDSIATDNAVQLKPGLEAVVEGMVRYCIAYMDPVEVMYYMEHDAPKLLVLKREDVSLLLRKIRVSLLMNKSRTEAMLKINQQALATALQYAQLPPHLQATLRPIYVQTLKSLDVVEIDMILPKPDPQAIEMSKQAAAMAMLPPPPPTGTANAPAA